MGQQSSRQLTTWSWYKPSLAKLYEIVLLARSSLFVQLFLKLHLSNHIPSNRLKSELPTHCHVKTCHTQNHPTEEPTDAPSPSITHEAYVFLAVKVGSEMDQFGKVKHFVMQLNIPGKNSFDERFSIFSYVTAGSTSSQTILEIRLDRWVVVNMNKKKRCVKIL